MKNHINDGHHVGHVHHPIAIHVGVPDMEIRLLDSEHLQDRLHHVGDIHDMVDVDRLG